MKNFNLTIENELAILEKYRLTAEELFIIRLLFLSVEENENSYLIRYVNLNRDIFHTTLYSLQEKGVINKSYVIPDKGEKFIPSDVSINKNFMKTLFNCSFELGNELFEHYPQFTVINGVTVPLRSVSKKFDSLEDAFKAYGKAIRFKEDAHKEVIRLVDWAKENNLLNCSLASFIVDQKWRDLQCIEDGSQSNINYNAVKLL